MVEHFPFSASSDNFAAKTLETTDYTDHLKRVDWRLYSNKRRCCDAIQIVPRNLPEKLKIYEWEK